MKPFEGEKNLGVTLEGRDEIAVVSSGLAILLERITPEIVAKSPGMQVLNEAGEFKDTLDMLTFIADPALQEHIIGVGDAPEVVVEADVENIVHLHLVRGALNLAKTVHDDPKVRRIAAAMQATFAEINPPLAPIPPADPASA
jgi:hypothetical protein